MIPGVAEASAVAKAGASILKAFRTDSRDPQWPNLHESLLALYALLDEWCAAAAITSAALRTELKNRADPPKMEPVIFGGSNVIGSATFGGSIVQTVSFVQVIQGEIRGIMSPTAKLKERWRKKGRRAAARQGLRTILSVYFPGLLVKLEEATSERAEFIKRNSDLSKLVHQLSNKDLKEIDIEARKTHRALTSLANDLADLIVELFPVDPSGAKSSS